MTTPPPLWLLPPEPLALGAGDVHVWRASLDTNAATLGQLLATLSPDERERADRFHFQRDRGDYAAARGVLRDIVGRYLGVRPQRVRFHYSGHGKPSLAADMDAAWLRFNVSHAHGIALYAMSNGREVGVDVEYIREDIASTDIAQRFFSRDERSALDRLPSGRRTEAFFDCWTRKEAYIKGLGDGLSHPLESFTVSLGRGEAVSVRASDAADTGRRWTLAALDPGSGYAGALAVEGAVGAVRHWRWQ